MKIISIFKFSSIADKYFLDTKYKNATTASINSLGVLNKIYQIFAYHNVKISYLQTHFLSPTEQKHPKFLVDFSYQIKNSPNFSKAIIDLQKDGIKINDNPSIKIPWFPRKFEDLNKTCKALQELNQNQNHPQFQDAQYRRRRDQLVQIALNYRVGQKIPQIKYTAQQNSLWVQIYKKLTLLHRKSMCQKFIKQSQALNKQFKLQQGIPQLSQLSDYLQSKTGFRIRPINGILCQRQFLNCLAFKVFCSTQYIRNPKSPEYTPQPDIVHQIVGHVPMFADSQVAQISHMIGLLSLGASDEQIARLGALYWFTLQFGVCKQNAKLLAYGAGIAGSIAQITHMLSNTPRFQKFNILSDCTQSFPLTTMQPVFKYTESFDQFINDLKRYGAGIIKPISTVYNEQKQQIEYNRNIEVVTTL